LDAFATKTKVVEGLGDESVANYIVEAQLLSFSGGLGDFTRTLLIFTYLAFLH
jgi:hypothetical protein